MDRYLQSYMCCYDLQESLAFTFTLKKYTETQEVCKRCLRCFVALIQNLCVLTHYGQNNATLRVVCAFCVACGSQRTGEKQS
jgi:hypothetical protein